MCYNKNKKDDTMSALDDQLKLELEKLEKEEVEYMSELSDLPKGSLVLKNINGKDYPYLQYRSGDKFISNYIKKPDLDQIKSKLNRKKELEKALKQISFDKKRIRKIIR